MAPPPDTSPKATRRPIADGAASRPVTGGGVVATVTTPTRSSVDVRDMLCAQALALVSDALTRAPVGAWLDVRFNSADVRRDVEAWARDRGHPTRVDGPDRLTIQRGRQP